MQAVNQPEPQLTKEDRRQLKHQAREQEQRQFQRQQTARRVTRYFVAALAVGALGFWSWRFLTRPQPGSAVADLGNRHILSLEAAREPYNTIPPTSGPHVGDKATNGVHDEQIPDALQLHNLEDGGVIIHYDPQRVAAGMIDELKTLARRFGDRVLLEPYTQPALPAPIVLTAWTRIDRLETFDQERIARFIKSYRGVDHHKRF